MNDDLIGFMRARLTEDEAVARAATAGPWRATHRMDGTHHVFSASDRKVHRDGGYPADWPLDVVNPAADADHIARHGPAAVLRRITADRKLLDRHTATECKEFGCDCHSCCATCRWTANDERGTEQVWGEPTRHVYPCPTIRHLAESWGWMEEAT
jgi:hypothetical protein